jgi:hypothetical protein
MILLTRISSAKRGTKSLKTTIPEGVAEFLELSDKDQVEWKMEVYNNDRLATIKKSTSVGSIISTKNANERLVRTRKK